MVETLRQARKLPHKSGPKAACRPDIRSRLTPPGSTLSLTKQALSLRFNRKEFCDELYVHRKTPPLIIFVGSQAAFFTAG
jgi:hypothetical protein